MPASRGLSREGRIFPGQRMPPLERTRRRFHERTLDDGRARDAERGTWAGYSHECGNAAASERAVQRILLSGPASAQCCRHVVSSGNVAKAAPMTVSRRSMAGGDTLSPLWPARCRAGTCDSGHDE